MNDLSNDYLFFVGIDISKKKFDAAILDGVGKKLGHKIFLNKQDSFLEFLEWVSTLTNCSSNVLFVMEHTGIYSRLLWFFLQDQDCDLWVESGFVINRASGIKKAKNDKVDAYCIAEHALNRRYKVNLTPKYDDNLILLHDLLSNRNRVKDQLKAIETPLKEMKEHGNAKSKDILQDINRQAIEGLKDTLKKIDAAIDDLIEDNKAWKENIILATSVKGMGKIIVCWMLVYTRNFSKDMTARKFAAMAGIAPFEHTSGTSINKGSHNSHFSHKFFKGLLHLSVMSAIQHNPKIKSYFDRKKEEGKKGYIVMNNTKNKLVQIVFAVVRSQKVFEEEFIHKLAA
jgi:transposase